VADPGPVDVRLVEVDADSWRDCASVRPRADQAEFVADVTYYLSLCAYGDTWHPLAVVAGGEVVGFLMWGVDDDASRWIGGLVIDAAHQRRGLGRAAVVQAVRLLVAQDGCANVALSYQPANTAARDLYAALGFVETGETEDEEGEVVARLDLAAAKKLLDG
jgi:diamine N-acetyltransferase